MSFITSPGVAGFSNQITRTAPNNAVPISYFISTGSDASIDAAFGPKGAGAISGQIPDNGLAGGNKRGQYAIDWQLNRNAVADVASGSSSTISGGGGNRAAGVYAIVPGGYDNYASGANSMVAGRSASDRGINGVFAFQPNSGNARGDTSLLLTVQRMITTGVVPSLLNTIGGTNTTVNQSDRSFVLSSFSVMTFDIDLLAIGNGTGEYATWKITGSAQQGVGVANTTIIQQTVTLQGNSAGFAGLAVAVVADVGVGAWAVQVTGLAATIIKWQAFVKTQFAQY